MTPPWVEALPWLLRAPTQYLYVDTLLPSDDFLTQLRKLFFAVAVLMAMGPVSLTVLNALTLPADQPLFAKTFASLHCVVLPFYWVTIYVLSRRGCVSTRTLAIWWIYGSAVPAFMTTISTPDFPIQETFILLFIIAQLLRAPMLPLLAAVFAVGHLIASHNAAAYHRGEPDVPLVAIPGVAMREYPYRIALVAMSFSVVAVVMAALRFQLSESDRQTTQATATSELALAIAQRLGEYDTAGAHALLDGAASMDSSLRDAMKVLIDNLDKYRPHLPNWVVGDAEDFTDHHPMRRTSDAVSTSHMETTETSAAPERSVRSSGRSSGGTAPLTAIIHGDAGWFRGGQAFESFASFALIKFYVCDGEPFSAASSASMTSFVDTVHRLASQTSGAVHSFVGDTLSLSWNAASRAVQSESKAVRMVARLKKAADSTCWRITGAVQSGKMCVQLAGGVESRQQALTLTSPWVSANLAPLLVTAAQRGLAIVTDHRTRVGAAHAASFRPTAAVQQPGARLGIFELLCENGADSDADEWIYVLARQQQAERDGMLQSTIDVTDALELWVKGDDDAAAAKLGIANSDGREWSATVAAAINARCK